MKIMIAYPPIETEKGVPLLSQNRQFQYFNEPTYIYPIVPASAATLLNQAGYEVIWSDGIAEEKTYSGWLEEVKRESPDLIAMETKTPVVKRHWQIIEEIKNINPRIKTILTGDHVTALPEESMEKSKVDFILTGGDYDFLLLNLVKFLKGKDSLELGIWYRERKGVKNTGRFRPHHDLNSLPFIDRELTKWWLYSEKNGNYKKTPGTYIMAGRDCWWHRCSFCSWTTLYPNYRVRTPRKVLDEIGELIRSYPVKEIFDDTGTFPRGKWLENFCQGMIERGYNKKVNLGCNLKFGPVTQEQYHLMKKAGFRYLLFGFESGKQETLDRVNKGIKVRHIIEGCKMAKKAGLEPHLTIMLGYPWETKEDVVKTIKLAKDLFRKGYADTLQATIVIPYPGTPLFEYCKHNNLLKTRDWDDYDMRKPVMKTPLSEHEIIEATQKLYKVFFTPQYILRRLVSIRNFNDLSFIKRGLTKISGHLKDFSSPKETQ